MPELEGGVMRYVSTFSGVEAASLAWAGLGWEPVAFCEIDPFPSAVLAERYPDGPRYKAIGNSMAVPVMRFIGERIQMVEESGVA